MKELKNGRYRYVSEPIGEGRTSQVFKGIDTVTNREIAIKRMFKSMVKSTELKAEVRIMKKIPKHPFICGFIDFFKDESYSYIIMEYTGLERLGYCRYGKQFPEHQAINIILNILKGIKPIHKAGILHCDLSPHNILLSKDGKIIQIIDFGCAVVKDKNGEFKGLHKKATKGFNPPEQKRRARVSHLNDSSDIYGIGSLLLYLLNGKAPINKKEAYAEVKDRDLRNIIIKATRYEKSRRYQSANEMIRAISSLKINNKSG